MTVNGGYGSFESRYMQSLAVLDTATGKVEEFPDERTLGKSNQVLFSGLAFSADGKHMYGSVVSLTDPTGKADGDTGSGIQVYGFSAGKMTRERVLKIPPQKLAAGKTTLLGKDQSVGVPYPAGIAVWDHVTFGKGGKGRKDISDGLLLVADNLSDAVVEFDTANGHVVKRFDLSESDAVPGTYPASILMTPDGNRAFVALWNSSELVELDLGGGKSLRKLTLLKADSPVKPSSHPTALQMSPDGNTLYVALGNRDAVAAVDLGGGGFKLKGFFDTRLPGQSFFGAVPEALALSADGIAAVCGEYGFGRGGGDRHEEADQGVAEKGMAEPMGFIPTEWMPMGVAFAGGKLYIATRQGDGDGAEQLAAAADSGDEGQQGVSADVYVYRDAAAWVDGGDR